MTNDVTSSPTSFSFFQWVIFWLAFSVNTKPSAAFVRHFSRVFSLGKWRKV